MNSDPALPFGKDITRQIKGMVSRYPDIDGVFLDQACYNFLDTAHDDGMTAIDNRPAYMTGLNYYPHLELLSSLLHPSKAIIANGPFSIGIMKYVDGYMAEGSGWLCDHLQYYGISKPMFFLVYESDDRNIELMFRRCLIYGAGFTSYASATGSKDLYDLYLPLLRRMFGRRWVFDANPIQPPTGYAGGLYRKSDGLFVASVVGTMPRYSQRSSQPSTVCLSAAGLEDVQQVRLHVLGSEMQNVSFHREGSAVHVDVPGDAQACVIELEAKNSGMEANRAAFYPWACELGGPSQPPCSFPAGTLHAKEGKSANWVFHTELSRNRREDSGETHGQETQGQTTNLRTTAVHFWEMAAHFIFS